MDVIYLKSIDGSEITDKKILEWLYFGIDTFLIKDWYKNGNGYFVKLHNRDDFVKIERSEM